MKIPNFTLTCPTERRIVTGSFCDYSRFGSWLVDESVSRTSWCSRPNRRFAYAGKMVLTHNGLDLRAYWGDAIYAAHDGIVVVAAPDWTGYKGFCLVIEYPHKLEGAASLYSLYAHLDKTNKDGLTVGQQVQAGQRIGHSGRQGRDHPYPSHLHFELRARSLDCKLPYGQYGYEAPETLHYLNPALYFEGLRGV